MIERPILLCGIALKHLSKRRRQTAVAVVGVAIGVGFFLAVSAMMIGSQRDFIRRLIDAAPHIVISDEPRTRPVQPGLRLFGQDAVTLHGYKIRTEARGIWNWPSIVASANAISGALASPSLSGGIALRLGGHEEALAIVGVDPDLEARISTIDENLRHGHLHDLKAVQGGLIIGEEMAGRLGIGMGDIVAATSTTGASRSLRIVGLFKKGQAQLAETSGFVLLREAQALLDRPFIINRIAIRLANADQADAVATQIEARFGYKAESWQARSADVLSLLVTRNVIMYSVVSAILLVASFGIYTAVSNSVADKRRDIAILRSIGFSETDLQIVFVIEGLLLALSGILAGWLLGYGLMQLLGAINFPIAGEGQHLPLDRSFAQYGIAAAASLTAGITAAWLPARKASKVDPVDILRGAA